MLKLLSVNVKCDYFTDRILDLIKREQPDVLCLQEVLEPDIPAIEAAMGARLHVVPMGVFAGVNNRSGKDEPFCVGIAARYPVQKVTCEHYAKYHDGLQVVDEINVLFNRLLLTAEILHDGEVYRIATTHFTWTPHAFPDERQERDLAVFLKLLVGLGDFVLCGDLNAPRGMATFDTLAARYTDHIPAHYTSSLDPELHRLKGSIQLMIDGLFTTPEYECSDVELIFGVSDHAAIRAFLTKR